MGLVPPLYYLGVSGILMKIMIVNDTTIYTNLVSLPDKVLVMSTSGLHSCPDFPNITKGSEYLIYKDVLGSYGIQVLFASTGEICIRRYNEDQWESWRILVI